MRRCDRGHPLTLTVHFDGRADRWSCPICSLFCRRCERLGSQCSCTEADHNDGEDA